VTESRKVLDVAFKNVGLALFWFDGMVQITLAHNEDLGGAILSAIVI